MESEEELLSLFPDTWRDMATSLLKVQRSESPSILPVCIETPGNPHARSSSQPISQRKPFPVASRSGASSADEQTGSASESRHDPRGPFHSEAVKELRRRRLQQQGRLPYAKIPWWFSLPTDDDNASHAQGEEAQEPLNSQMIGNQKPPGPFNSRKVHRASISTGMLVTTSPLGCHDSTLLLNNSEGPPVSSTPVGIHRNQAPGQLPQSREAEVAPSYVEFEDRVEVSAASLDIEKQRHSSKGGATEVCKSCTDTPAAQEHETAECRRLRTAFLSRLTDAAVDLTPMAPDLKQTYTPPRAAENLRGDNNNEGESCIPWVSTFRIISGNNRRTKRRTLVAPRCHDAYGQLAAASTWLLLLIHFYAMLHPTQ